MKRKNRIEELELEVAELRFMVENKPKYEVGDEVWNYIVLAKTVSPSIRHGEYEYLYSVWNKETKELRTRSEDDIKLILNTFKES